MAKPAEASLGDISLNMFVFDPIISFFTVSTFGISHIILSTPSCPPHATLLLCPLSGYHTLFSQHRHARHMQLSYCVHFRDITHYSLNTVMPATCNSLALSSLPIYWRRRISIQRLNPSDLNTLSKVISDRVRG